VVGDKNRKKSQSNTMMKTMDTHNRNSNVKGNQFNLEISPASKFDNKFNSNLKESVPLLDKEVR